ncbi:unnamed protein product [Hermetia illucens]|uniref:Uncharacterized protein n=1 Tax=Hermetia illucens TaxID=343691 RepID=A0A7R8YNT9_HERIL|nr:protein brunelleschi isoform X2 [Hermetia illucens]CAD7080031.1 unnamed protein product [Hermetia illucens]
MRSTVSYMLSHGPGEPIMSHPDYEQHAHHHGCLLVLLRGIGPAKPRYLQRIFEKVQKVNNVKITDSAGQHRDIWVRFVYDHPVENNDWGDFQTHRRLLGLVTIGKFETQTELNELCRLHESLKVKYTNTLYDSRCILFGPLLTSPSNASSAVDTNSINSEQDRWSTQPRETQNHSPKKLEEVFTTPSNFKSRAFFYQENDPCSNLEEHISEFISSLFWILESKRLDRSREKIDKVPLLLAPFEKKDFVGLDLESRNNRKRCIGRVTKNLGDLTLQAGLVAESLNLFHAASETLRAISDALWLGAADEGLCAASAILLYPGVRQTESFYRNASLQEGVSPNKLAAERRRSSGVEARKQHFSTIVEQQNSIENSISSNSSSSSSVSSILTSSSSSTLSGNQNTFRNDALPSNILSPDEIVNHYRKAIINYSKYRHAGVVETEAALKAARICIEQNKNLDVSMFLQNVLYINLTISEQERAKRFEVLTDLYQKIGYRRKAAFCQRLAAWRHVAQGNQQPDWIQTYRLMLESFPGHMLSLDPLEVLENNAGWSMLQIDLLQQLVIAAKRLGHSALATRHMTYLLQTQWNNMGPAEQKDMALQLQNLSAQCEGSPVPLVLENGTVIPPANLTDIPYCIHFQVKDLPSHLRPHKISVNKVDNGPFLFTPIHFSSIDRRVNKKTESKIAFHWIQNDLSEVVLKLKNTLPFELTVSDMRLLTNGIVFEALPQTVVLQPAVPTTITLHGTPIESGQLEIQGYSTHTLGVKSNCRLKHMKDRPLPPNYCIDVIPSLPKISAKTSLPQTATFSNLSNSDSVITSASLTMFNGETTECLITLKNESTMIAIEYLDASIHSSIETELQGKIFQFNLDEIQSQLPIKPQESIDFTLRIFGEADFLSVHSQLAGLGSSSSHSAGGVLGAPNEGPQSLNYSMLSSGHASLPSRVSSPTHMVPPRRTELTSSFRSSHSGGHSSLATLSFPPPSSGNNIQNLEAQLRLRYSGGDGLQEGYCRQCAVSFSLEMLPSAQITNWDVLPAETPSQFYLVLDVSNLTTQEMSLNYTDTKNILIEAKESCRVPIPVDRCSMEKLCNNENNGKDKDNDSAQTPSPFIEISEKLCSEHIAERVKLNWTLTGTETKGIASLKGITLSPAMIDLITVAPLQWAVTFDNKLVQPQSEIVYTSGQCVALNVTVCNLSQAPLRQLALTVQFYQDYQNSVHNYHLDTRVAMSGPNQTLIPLLQQNEKAEHNCSIIFFTPGRFKANIQCRSLASSADNVLTPASHQVVTSNQASFYEAQHVWRFIPPVEVTVVE